MLLSDLSIHQLEHRLRHEGIALVAGPFTFQIRSPGCELAPSIHQLYADTPLATEDVFVDFHVRVRTAAGPRKWFKPQSLFDLDGMIPFKPMPGQHAFALLEWGMNWCIYSHGHFLLVIHGAVLEKHGSACLIPGPSGSGKSTLCAAMMNSGWRLLSDELILIDPASGHVLPLCRPISLKNASITIMQEFAPDAVITAPIADTTKGSVAHMRPSKLSSQKAQVPAIPALVVFPTFQQGAETQITPMQKPDVFAKLAENAFNYHILGTAGFEVLAGTVDRSDGFTARYSKLEDVIQTLEDMAITAADQ